MTGEGAQPHAAVGIGAACRPHAVCTPSNRWQVGGRGRATSVLCKGLPFGSPSLGLINAQARRPEQPGLVLAASLLCLHACQAASQPASQAAARAAEQCTATNARTMPARVQTEAEAMCGTMTALGQSASPGFMAGSSSNTSRPHLRRRGSGPEGVCVCMALHGAGGGAWARPRPLVTPHMHACCCMRSPTQSGHVHAWWVHDHAAKAKAATWFNGPAPARPLARARPT